METFSALLALCAGNSLVAGEFPSQRPVTWSFDVSFELCLNKRVNNHEDGELRRHRAHCDVIVMFCIKLGMNDDMVYRLPDQVLALFGIDLEFQGQIAHILRMAG